MKPVLVFQIYLFVFLQVTNSASISPGGVLTLNTCGSYDDYQKWSTNNGMLSLSSYSDACLQCSDRGYCGNGFKPVITNQCDSSWTEKFSFSPITGKSSINIKVNGRCLQNIGIGEYAPIQTLQCDIGYDNNILQEYYYDANTGYIKSDNQSLCVTAAYYPLKNCSDSPFKTYPYCNQDLDIDSRVNDLINRMTIYEKINNLAETSNGIPRLGIPKNKVLECLHGIKSGCGATYNGNTGCPTSFPNGLTLGALFNRTLWNKIGIVISDEGRALNNQNIGGLFCFSPDINLFLHPRWGRGQEVPGEDPYLTSQYAIQYITGIQYGKPPGQPKGKYLKMSNTVKHFADYNLEGCRYGVPCRGAFNANVSQQDQVEYYFPAWRSAIQVANVQSIMCSYNAINGVPACGNNEFINEIARNEWNFTGFVISDANAIVDDAFTTYVKQQNNGNDDPLIRTKIALENGCDADLGDAFYTQYMENAVATNVINISSVNQAVKRWLKVSFMLGQMDTNVAYKQYGKEYVDSPSNRQLAFSAAQQGIVLLKNKNNMLPLSNDNSNTYGFIGPHFNVTQYMLSSYRGDNTLVNSHSPYQVGMKQGINIKYALGCDVECANKSGFADAVNVAKSVDTVIMFIGLYPMQYAMPNQNYSQALEAEDFDRENVTFPGFQFDLLQAIYAANPNVVLVMINSAQIDLTWPKINIPAIIAAFYPGELGGDALISILYGDYSPAGKLPYTLYNMSIINNRDITDMSLSNNGGITYRYYTQTPVYSFGFGLSFTSFTYEYFNNSNSNSNSMINTAKLANFYRDNKFFHSDKTTQYIVQVTNTGKMNSDCVVLGFVTSENANATSPKIKLFDFQRVYVKIGQSVNVTLSVTAESISLTNKFGQERIVPGKYNLLMGDYQNNNYVKKEIQLIGKEEIIFDLAKINKKIS